MSKTEQVSVFYEMVETSSKYVNQIISLEGELANYVSSIASIMQSQLSDYNSIIRKDEKTAMKYASKTGTKNSQKVQVWTARLNSDVNLADNMKTLFNANEQATTQVLSKFGTDQSNFVQEMEGGIMPLQQTASLLGSPYTQ